MHACMHAATLLSVSSTHRPLLSRSEKTRVGKEVSGPLFSTLVGLAASNLMLIPVSAAPYTAVNKFLLPLAVPLLLFSADMRQVLSLCCILTLYEAWH